MPDDSKPFDLGATEILPTAPMNTPAGRMNAPTAPRGRATPPPRRPGDTLDSGFLAGSYIIDELAFEGGFASIYRARHVDTGQPAALKILHLALSASDRILARFEQEATALNRLHHPNIVEIYELGEVTEFRPYIAMEWLDGNNLYDELKARGPLSSREALAVMTELGAALQAAHELGIVHRDLKAHNVIALPRGDWFTLKLVDFGIAKLTAPDDQGTAMTTKTVIGTPHNMAPEQILCQAVDVRTDIYALGVLLYQLLTGRLPYRGSNLIEVEEMHLHATPPRASDLAPVSPLIDEVIARALHKRKEDRHATVTAMVEALRIAVEEGETGAFRVEDLGVGGAVGPGLALYVEARITGGGGGGGGDDDDDDLLDDIDDALDLAREAVAGAGLAVVLETPKTVLAAAPLAATDDHPARRRSLIEAAQALNGRLAGAGLDDAIAVAVVAHAADVEVLPLSGEPVGGPLLTLGEWPRGWPPRGVFASEAALAGVDGVGRAPVEGDGVAGLFRIATTEP